ncbi:MAG TPA: hypothetical protein VFX59_26735, partial [Polyangiales bacterium]|nr:hypothetical protein [Polyangiales bacterium]
MHAAHRYYNDLIALQRCKREEYRKLRSSLAPTELEDADGEVAMLVERMHLAQEQLLDLRRLSKKPSAQMKGESIALRQQLKAARARRAAARAHAAQNEDFKKSVSELEERARTWAKALRATTAAYWPNYQLAEASLKQAVRR